MKKLGLLGLLYFSVFSHIFCGDFSKIYYSDNQNYRYFFSSLNIDNFYEEGTTIWVQDLDNNKSIIQNLFLRYSDTIDPTALRMHTYIDHSTGIYSTIIERWFFLHGWQNVGSYSHKIVVDNQGPEVIMNTTPVLKAGNQWYNSDVVLKATPNDSIGTNRIDSSFWLVDTVDTVDTVDLIPKLDHFINYFQPI